MTPDQLLDRDSSLGHLPLLGLGAAVLGGLVMLAWRVRETRRPVTVGKIVAPPLGMSTGLFMFVARAPRVPWSWAAAAFAAGALVLAIPLARSSRLERQGEAIVLRRSRAFLWILLGLLSLRLALRAEVEQWVTPVQTGAIFFLLALGMILRWRLGMLLEFLRLRRGAPGAGPVAAA